MECENIYLSNTHAGTLMPMFADSLASQQQSQMGGSAATYSSTSTAGFAYFVCTPYYIV